MTKYFERIAFLTLVLMVLSCSEKKFEKEGKMEVCLKVANQYKKERPDLRNVSDGIKWSYTNGLCATAYFKLWQATKNEEYLTYVRTYPDSMVLKDGTILKYKKEKYDIDMLNSGKILIDLHQLTGAEFYKLGADNLLDQINNHPRTSEGGFWHKKRYTHQMWLDGLYMGSPFLAKYAAAYNKPELFDDVANQFYLIDKYTWDKDINLYKHAWDESKEQSWANPVTGRSLHAWGRGMGWLAMAIIDVLEYFPKDHSKYNMLVQLHRKIADAVIGCQDETGVWHQVLDVPEREGNYLEGTVSAMFSYFLLKSIEDGYLKEAKYTKAAQKAIEGYNRHLIFEREDGSVYISPNCAGAGLGGDPYRKGDFDYYINKVEMQDHDPKAVAPYIMAILIYERLYSSTNTNTQ